jgi:hypothetical protein
MRLSRISWHSFLRFITCCVFVRLQHSNNFVQNRAARSDFYDDYISLMNGNSQRSHGIFHNNSAGSRFPDDDYISLIEEDDDDGGPLMQRAIRDSLIATDSMKNTR